MNPKDYFIGCPVQNALKYIGGKWQIGIIWHLRKGPLRFSEFQKMLLGISEKVLTSNLKLFETEGMVQREVYPSLPIRVEYRLTSKGELLVPIVEKIILWSYGHLQDEKASKEMSFTPRVVMDELEDMSN